MVPLITLIKSVAYTYTYLLYDIYIPIYNTFMYFCRRSSIHNITFLLMLYYIVYVFIFGTLHTLYIHYAYIYYI
jgi:hypothetical protein